MTEPGKMPSVLVVDDHPAIRNAVRRVLHRKWTVLLASGGAEARAFTRGPEKPVAAIVDLGLPGEDGFALVTELGEMGLKVIIYSGSNDQASIDRAISAGADGFLGKGRNEAELGQALHAVLKGEGIFPDECVAPTAALPLRLESLTPKEREALKHLRRGLSSREVAALMGVSEKTIERHRANIRSRAGLSEDEFADLLKDPTGSEGT